MAWQQTGSLKGPQGDPGPQGEQGPIGPAGPDGPEGPRGPAGPDGPEGPRGPQGEDGKGIEIAGQVATYADLPGDLTPGDAGQGYLVAADGRLYVWSGTAFPDDGQGVEFQGPEGPEGPRGPAGPDGGQGPQGADGPQGPEGPTGPAGPRGTRWFVGDGAPGDVVGSTDGDIYLDRVTGTFYVQNGG